MCVCVVKTYLTGYVGAKSFLEQLHSLVLELKANNKDMMFVCDPVMGDNGKWVHVYVTFIG